MKLQKPLPCTPQILAMIVARFRKEKTPGKSAYDICDTILQNIFKKQYPGSFLDGDESYGNTPKAYAAYYRGLDSTESKTL
jgi:hypothetical protein